LLNLVLLGFFEQELKRCVQDGGFIVNRLLWIKRCGRHSCLNKLLMALLPPHRVGNGVKSVPLQEIVRH
jgi:hypothetical protein